tara:strand:- start:654 stop:866 length:213 start_codon:yes stop_codon:yes gene_type:complete
MISIVDTSQKQCLMHIKQSKGKPAESSICYCNSEVVKIIKTVSPMEAISFRSKTFLKPHAFEGFENSLLT